MKLNSTYRDDTQFVELAAAAGAASGRALRKVTARIARKAKKKAPEQPAYMRNPWVDAKRGGAKQLKKNIRTSVKQRKKDVLYTAAIFTSDNKGALIELGTGIHGPKRRIIVPKRKRFMAWMERAWWVRMKRVRGRKATPYLLPALKEEAPKAVHDLKSELNW